jgi:U6 snRNA-associated Sm-like protein LSm4
MLPLGLLNAAVGHPMLVELKDGDTLNGHLASCDTWMNLVLKEVVQTSAEGDKFHRLPEAYVRGNNVSLSLPALFVGVRSEGRAGRD